MSPRPPRRPSGRYKLGLVPAPPDPRTLQLARYRTAELPPPRAAANWLSQVPVWGVLANNRIGDCYPAGCAHLTQAWTFAANRPWNPTDDDVITAYERVSGYDPRLTLPDGSNPTDVGCASLPMLNYWRRVGIAGRKIAAYVQVNLADRVEVETAIDLFGGVIATANLPVDAETQLELNRAWVPTSGASGQPGSWGGHAIHIGAYSTRYLTCVTWGRKQRMTWSWLARYGMELYAAVSPSWLGDSGRSPNGLDLATLMADLRAITTV